MNKTFIALSAALLISACQPGGGETVSFKTVSQKMSCKEINSEKAKADEVIAKYEEVKSNSDLTNTASGAATNAAIYSGAGSSIPFLGSAMSLASGFASKDLATLERQAKEAEAQKNKLEGLAAGKGC
jgi:hypothetical protein